MARLTRKQMKQDEFIEAATDFGEWLEANWRKVVTWVGAFVVVALLVIGWYFIDKARKNEARAMLGKGYSMFQAAEDPDSESSGDYAASIGYLEEASDLAGSDPSGVVADFYHGSALLRTGEREAGLALLEKVANADMVEPLLKQSATISLARAYAADGDSSRAVEILREMAEDPDAVYPPDMALVLAGRILRDSGDDEGARLLWQEIVDDHPGTAGAREAESLLAQ